MTIKNLLRLVSIILIISISSCDDDPRVCDPKLSLSGYELGEMVAYINYEEVNFKTSFFRKNPSYYFIKFSHQQASNCYYDWELNIALDKEVMFNTTDTLFFNKSEITYFYNRSANSGGARYANDLDNQNWLLIKEVNQDSSIIMGEFEFTLFKDLPEIEVTVNNELLPNSYIFNNVEFSSEYLEE